MLVLCHSEFDPAGPSVAVSLLGEEKERNHELAIVARTKGCLVNRSRPHLSFISIFNTEQRFV
jgi:hypothetical protein